MRHLLNRLCYDRLGVFRFDVVRHPLFLAGLAVKVLAATQFAGRYFQSDVVPFVQLFLGGIHNPYNWFFEHSIAVAFPYPSGMLYILSLPGLLNIPDTFTLLTFRLPILCADILILLILTRWVRNKNTQLLLWYWCSPILFYISYIHGQLDAIPIALAFIAFHFLFREMWPLAAFALGAAIATKLNVLILVPFVAIYLYRAVKGYFFPFVFVTTTLGTAFLIALPHLFSVGFQNIVLHNPEQAKVFDLGVALGTPYILYVIPFVCVLLVARAMMFHFLNRDVLLMLVGFVLCVFTLLIPPQPGWYFWIIPFLVFFYIQRPTRALPFFVALNVLYFLYVSTAPYGLFTTHLSAYDIDPVFAHNIVFTVLQAVLLVNIVLIYRQGLAAGATRKFYNMPYLVGIAGDSGSGKTTCTELLTNVVGARDSTILEGDAMHKWERNHEQWKSYTHLDPRANHLHADIPRIAALKQGRTITRRIYDHATGRFTDPFTLTARPLTIIEGLHPFFLPEVRKALDLKLFIAPDEELRTHWKLRRDVAHRGKTRESVLDQISARLADAQKYIQPQAEHADMIVTQRAIVPIGERLGDDFEPDTKLTITTDLSVDYEPLATLLEQHLTVIHTYSENRQHIEFTGTISAQNVTRIATELLPELYTRATHEPRFDADYNGVLQLMVFFRIVCTLKDTSHEF